MKKATPSPATERIRLWYRARNLDKGWTKDRYLRLCNLLHCTVHELAAMIGVPGGMITLWLKRNCIPPYVSLHLELINQAYADMTCGSKGLPIIPFHLLHNENPPPPHSHD